MTERVQGTGTPFRLSRWKPRSLALARRLKRPTRRFGYADHGNASSTDRNVDPGRFQPLRLVAKADVQQPGSRGGQFYIDDNGHVRYGTPLAGKTPFHGAASHALRLVTTKRSGIFAGRKVTRPRDTAEIFRDATNLSVERFWMVHLDAKDRPIAVELVSQGSLTASIVHPRDTFKNALALGTRSVAFMHNHPSGQPRPSNEDLALGLRLSEVARSLGIGIKHHVVMGTHGYTAITGPALAEVGLTEQLEVGPNRNKRELRRVESTIDVQNHGTPWSAVFQVPIHSGYDVYRVGRGLVDAKDKTALLLSLDQQNRVIGVFPIAHGEIDEGTTARAVRTAIASNAASAVIVAGQDGQNWQRSLERAHGEMLREVKDGAGVNYHDTVVVGDGGYSSMSTEGTLVDPRSPRWS